MAEKFRMGAIDLMNRVSLIIPALNEAECLSSLIADIPSGLVDQVIVVDNGSTDNTCEVARASGAEVIYEPRRGYGYACAAGAAAAQGNALAFMDGDGSFLPDDLHNLLVPIHAGNVELVLGSRLTVTGQGSGMPSHQHFGNWLFVRLLRRRFGLVITDLGPFRVIRQALLSGLDMRERTYGWPLEMIIKTARKGLPIVEIPVSYRPRIAGQSKVSGTLSGSLLTAWRFINVWLRYAG